MRIPRLRCRGFRGEMCRACRPVCVLVDLNGKREEEREKYHCEEGQGEEDE